jgi:uncharacterized LabA/DUF88 family protein
MLIPEVKTHLIIEGSNLYQATRALGFEVEFKKLQQIIAASCKRLMRSSYYAVVADSDEHNPLVRLVDWLSYNGFSVVTKLGREFVDPDTGRRRVRGSMDVEVAVGLMEAVHLGHAEQIILFAGTPNLASAVEAVRRHGTRVVLVSAEQVADAQLRQQSDAFVDLAEIAPQITRRMLPPRQSEEEAGAQAR